MEKEIGRYSYLYCSYSESYLTLTAGDKGIQCPSESPKQCKKRPLGAPPFATMASSCQRRLPPRSAGCTASRHACLEGSQSDTLVGVLEPGCALTAYRGKYLAAGATLSGPGACRSPSLAGTRGASQQVFLEVPWLAFPASSSCRGLASSRQAPLAGALSSHLEYFVLEWLPGKLLLPGSCFLKSHRGSWR